MVDELNTEDFEFDEEDNKNLRGLDKFKKDAENLVPRIRKKPDKLSKKFNEHQKIAAFLSEYLGPYMIVGYTANEEEFFIMRSSSPMETKALNGLVDEMLDHVYNAGYDPDDD